jgi:hypothetical protein
MVTKVMKSLPPLKAPRQRTSSKSVPTNKTKAKPKLAPWNTKPIAAKPLTHNCTR